MFLRVRVGYRYPLTFDQDGDVLEWYEPIKFARIVGKTDDGQRYILRLEDREWTSPVEWVDRALRGMR